MYTTKVQHGDGQKVCFWAKFGGGQKKCWPKNELCLLNFFWFFLIKARFNAVYGLVFD